MGQVKRILITGAGGYLGRRVVAEARARGHLVRALVRREGAIIAGWLVDPDIERVVLDLAQDDLTGALRGIDAVIHTAAALAGGDDVHAVDTVTATRRLLAAMAAQETPPRLVLASSMSVYAGLATPEGSVVDETTPLEDRPDQRDAYCRAKLAQEDLARHAGLEAWILRIGAIYGPGRLWNAHLGPRLGPVLVRFSNTGELPLCHVANCAQALVMATDQPAGGIETVNLVDDDLPDRVQFLAAMGNAAPRLSFPVPLGLMSAFARMASMLPGRKPGLLRPATLAARMRPVRYDNARAKARLGWSPGLRFVMAMRDAIGESGDAG